MTLGLESKPDNGQYTKEVREKQGWGVETSRRGAEDNRGTMAEVGGSETVACFCA